MGESDSSSNKIGLALSGGGYRATLFGLGSLVRLNELGILKNISRISSVSGGSILNAYLAMRWPDLKFNSSGVADNFHDVIVKKILEYCSETTISKVGIGLNLINPFSSNPKSVRKQYDKLLFDGKLFSSIAKIPAAPQFLFYGTGLQTGASVRMVDSLLYDYNIGAIDISQWSIATVVGISSAFPPVLSPVILKLDRTNWIKSKYEKFLTMRNLNQNSDSAMAAYMTIWESNACGRKIWKNYRTLRISIMLCLLTTLIFALLATLALR